MDYKLSMERPRIARQDWKEARALRSSKPAKTKARKSRKASKTRFLVPGAGWAGRRAEGDVDEQAVAAPKSVFDFVPVAGIAGVNELIASTIGKALRINAHASEYAIVKEMEVMTLDLSARTSRLFSSYMKLTAARPVLSLFVVLQVMFALGPMVVLSSLVLSVVFMLVVVSTVVLAGVVGLSCMKLAAKVDKIL
ncbi:uncharacterized protein V1510DRAFT_401053 [Dipodascopsis tothii]|uniref:uncharacterized protein n=1 Tax=Dipodascopsis tothii TaxID=44089 RepID=UPI0034CFE402